MIILTFQRRRDQESWFFSLWLFCNCVWRNGNIRDSSGFLIHEKCLWFWKNDYLSKESTTTRNQSWETQKMIRNSQLLKNSIQSLNTVRVFGQQSLLRSFGTSINDVMDLGKTYNPGKYWVSQAGIPIVDGKVHVDASIKDSILTQINKKVSVVAFNRPYVWLLLHVPCLSSAWTLLIWTCRKSC